MGVVGILEVGVVTKESPFPRIVTSVCHGDSRVIYGTEMLFVGTSSPPGRTRVSDLGNVCSSNKVCCVFDPESSSSNFDSPWDLKGVYYYRCGCITMDTQSMVIRSTVEILLL